MARTKATVKKSIAAKAAKKTGGHSKAVMATTQMSARATRSRTRAAPAQDPEPSASEEEEDELNLREPTSAERDDEEGKSTTPDAGPPSPPINPENPFTVDRGELPIPLVPGRLTPTSAEHNDEEGTSTTPDAGPPSPPIDPEDPLNIDLGELPVPLVPARLTPTPEPSVPPPHLTPTPEPSVPPPRLTPTPEPSIPLPSVPLEPQRGRTLSRSPRVSLPPRRSQSKSPGPTSLPRHSLSKSPGPVSPPRSKSPHHSADKSLPRSKSTQEHSGNKSPHSGSPHADHSPPPRTPSKSPHARSKSPSTHSRSPSTLPPPPVPKPGLVQLGLENLATHRERNPGAPQQPSGKKGKGKEKAVDGKSTAEENTAVLKRQLAKDSRDKLKVAVKEFRDGLDKRAIELSEELSLPLDEVYKALRATSSIKKKKGYVEFNAKVSKYMELANEGREHGDKIGLQEARDAVSRQDPSSWSEEELKELKEEWMKKEAEKQVGTRGSNAEAARDITRLGDHILQEFLSAEARTGVQGICILSGTNPNDTIQPNIIGTSKALGFVQDGLKMTPTTLALKFSKWGCFQDGGNVKPKLFAEKRAQVVSRIEAGLREKTGIKYIKMEYVHYEEIICAGLGIELQGWPEDRAMVAPSRAGRGGADLIDTLWDGFASGNVKWVDCSPERKAELKIKYPNASSKKSRATKRKAGSDDEEEVPTSKKRKEGSLSKEKKRKQDGERDGRKEKTKEKGKKKAKQVEGLEKEVQPPVRKRKRVVTKPTQDEEEEEELPKRKRKKGGPASPPLEEEEEEEEPTEKKKKAFALRRRHHTATKPSASDESGEEEEAPSTAKSKSRRQHKFKSSSVVRDTDDEEVQDPLSMDKEPLLIPTNLDDLPPETQRWWNLKAKMMKDREAADLAKKRMDEMIGIAGIGSSSKLPPVKTLSEIHSDGSYESSGDDDDDDDD
ncbi:hypothetical protein C8R43DRAFT_956255 [Mycena crocata]|nr:hypothetical protein C8R43DRAFT_956255 [Mycena crocata]